MSSLQKFHRRTNGGVPVVSPFPTIGAGNNTVGYWLGDISTNKIIVAPLSTEVSRAWGSYGTSRGTTSTTNGLANTNTLYAFGSAAHPAAYYCKTLATGGYNTWYLPAVDEILVSMYPNKSATPFATANQMANSIFETSTEIDSGIGQTALWSTGVRKNNEAKHYENYVRAIRRTTV